MSIAGKKRSIDGGVLDHGQSSSSLAESSVNGSSRSGASLDNNGRESSKEVASNGNDSGSDGWTAVTSGTSRKKQKKELKKLAKQGVAEGQLATPLFQFDPAGFRGRNSIGIHDVRDLILNILAKESHPRWLKISNKKAIRGVVCILVQGIDPPTLGLTSEPTDNLPQALITPTSQAHSKLPIFPRLFSHYCPTKAPGDQKRLHSVLQTLLNAPIPKNEKAARDTARNKAANAHGGIDPAIYLLRPEDFPEHGYIVPTYAFDVDSRVIPQGSKIVKQGHSQLPFEQWKRSDGLIETPQTTSVDGPPPLLKILGIDCEMCVTTAGSEVCRISVVDGDGKVIYNTLVKPTNKVLDYATVYSGITEELLENVTTTLEDVQRKLAELIDYDTVLVGHSLNCDLVVLKLAHPWIIDTSVIFHHTRGPPFKASLKWLAQKWLNKEIQKPTKTNSSSGLIETIGHNSEEDARAAVELLRMKMQKGPSFGEFANDSESIFERLGRATEPPRKTCIVDHGNPGQWHGAKADKAISCKTDEDIVEGILENVESHDFVFARLMDLSHTLGWSQPSNAAKGKTASTANQKTAAITDESGTASKTGLPEDSDEDEASIVQVTPEEAYKRTNEHLERIHASLPLNTAFIVLSGHGDPRTVTSLTAKKNRFDVLFKTGTPLSTMSTEDKWMESDDRALMAAVNRVREGMSFLAIKR